MKRTLSLVISIALLCSLFGCTSSASETPGQKLIFTAVPTEEIGFIKIPDEKKGSEKAELVYQNLSEVKITLNGKTEPLEDAIRTGKITGAEIFAYARMDAENGFCKESFSSDDGLTHFIYGYPDYALEIAYDVLESPDGRQTLINEITIADTAENISSSDHFYVDESSRWGYFLDREDWGLEFTVKTVTPESLTVTYTQKQAQELGELTVDGYIMFAEMEGAQDEFVAQTGRDAPGFPIAITSDGTGEITIDWSETAGKLNPGTYYLRITVTDNYDPEKVPANVTKRYSKQAYCVEFTVEP